MNTQEPAWAEILRAKVDEDKVRRLLEENARLQERVEEHAQKRAEAEEEARRLQMCEGMARTMAEERDALQERVEEAEEKARRYDSWFEKGRCPACHFKEKHMASCPVGRYKALAERRKEALENDVRYFVKQWELYMNCGQRGAAQEVSDLLDDARAAIEEKP